jgi:Icc-related predicted phosphoesterase
MKIVAIADQHGILPAVPPCDLLLLGGDLCPVENHRVAFQAEWLDRNFRRWLDSLTHVRKIVGVAGNHDWIFQTDPERVPKGLRWEYLQDSGTEFEGFKIWGSPWQPVFFDWAFNLGPDQLKEKWALIPEGTDILVLHGPPLGFGDAVPRRGEVVEHCGCPHLAQRISELQPRLAIFGHVHEGRGQWRHGRTLLANVSLVDVHYQPVHEPWTCELALA